MRVTAKWCFQLKEGAVAQRELRSSLADASETHLAGLIFGAPPSIRLRQGPRGAGALKDFYA